VRAARGRITRVQLTERPFILLIVDDNEYKALLAERAGKASQRSSAP